MLIRCPLDGNDPITPSYYFFFGQDVVLAAVQNSKWGGALLHASARYSYSAAGPLSANNSAPLSAKTFCLRQRCSTVLATPIDTREVPAAKKLAIASMQIRMRVLLLEHERRFFHLQLVYCLLDQT